MHSLRLLLLLLGVLFLWSCDTPEQRTEHPMDRPEVQRLLFHPRREARTALPEGAEDIDIEVEAGIRIGCRFFSAGKDKPTILFFHGNGEIAADYDALGPLYARHDLNLLVTDYRGYGWSDGTPSFSALLADCHTLYAEAKQLLQEKGYSPTLFLMGRSLGSASAIELAQAYNEDISGLIIDSGFAETLPLAETLGVDLEEVEIREEQTFNNSAKIRQVTKPTFLLHGQRDTLIPLWQAEKLHAECGARTKELQVVPGADHNSLISIGGKYYFLAIQQFVEKVTGASDWRNRRKKFKARQAGAAQ